MMDNYYNMTTKPLHKPTLIMGIVAIATLWFTLGISGLVCGIIGLNLAGKNKYQYKTAAGGVLSLIALIISSIILVISVCIILILKLMPDSIGAYYIMDIIGSIFGI